MIEVTSTHWGPHHGPQSAMLLGWSAGAGDVTGNPSAHCHAGRGYLCELATWAKPTTTRSKPT